MSAFLAVRYDDRVEILTDGLCSNDDGTPAFVRRKVWTSDQCPIAITGRGNFAALDGIARGVLKMVECGNIDRVLAALEELLASHRAAGVSTMPAELLVVGFSEKDGPVAIYVPATGDKALVPERVEELAYGGPDIDITGIARLDKGLKVPGRYVMDQVRRLPGGNLVGGHLDWTIVAENGAETVRIWEWPDVIGEPIDPARKGWEPGWLEAA